MRNLKDYSCNNKTRSNDICIDISIAECYSYIKYFVCQYIRHSIFTDGNNLRRDSHDTAYVWSNLLLRFCQNA